MKARIRTTLLTLALALPALAQEPASKAESAPREGGSSHTSSVPEPGVLVVVGSGILALALFNRKKR